MKRLLCILLSLLMILPFAACGETDENAPGTDGATEEITEAETKEFFPAVERKNYNETFTMIGLAMPESWYWTEELTNEILNDAIYDMCMRISDYLGVDMVYEHVIEQTGGEVFAAVSPTVASGDDAYQLCIMHPYFGYNAFISHGYAFDFYEFDQLDFTQPYWNGKVIDSLAINDKAYIALGDLCRYQLNILYANKNRMRDAQREMPYDKVQNGTWTWDDFYALTKDLYVDADGDGKRNTGDIYGFTSLWDANGASALQAAGFYVAERNEEDQFTISFDEEKLIDFYDGLFAWANDESTYIWDFAHAMSNTGTIDFLEGRSYFTLEGLGTQFLSADFDVGILPLPKYDAAQDSYRHVNWGNNIVVPSSISNKDMVGDVLELQAFYARTVVQKAYYDTVLQYKVSNAPEDREMIELVYNTVVYDPGIAFVDGNASLSNLVYLTCFGIRQNTKKIASYLKSNTKSAQKTLDKLFKEKNR